MKQRTVVIIGSAYPLRGGLAAFNERIAQEYLKQGDKVILFSFSLQYPSVLFPGKTQYSDGPPPANLNIKTCINSVNPISWIKAGNEIAKLSPDLVIVKFWMPFMAPALGTICRRIRKKTNAKIISIIDNIIPHEQRPGDRALANYFVRSVDGFITMSRSVLEELNHFDSLKPKRFSPHPLYDHFGDPVPMTDARKALGLPEKGYIILFFGFIREYKGLDLLLKAMAEQSLKELPVTLLVAGEFYTNAKPYEELIDQLGIRDRVVMSNDFIPDADVANYFCAANLVVQPYKSATQSGVTQIAYHFNKPMIITDVGGLSEFVPNGKVGYVIAPDPEAIARSVHRYFSENKEEEFSENVASEKVKYSWQTMLDSIDNIQKPVEQPDTATG